METIIKDEEPEGPSARIARAYREETREGEPDLTVDGLSESFFVRLLNRLITRTRA